MPATCALTGKTYRKAHKRSHSMRASIVKLKANLQKVKIGNKSIKLSTRALRTLKKNKFKNYPLLINA
jgi:ribosomal protein L28